MKKLTSQEEKTEKTEQQDPVIAASAIYDNDQKFKNLIAQYPKQALRVFAKKIIKNYPAPINVTPVRQEMLQERFGERFRELDTPLKAIYSDGTIETIFFLFEQHTDPYRFSIKKIAHYALDLAELMKTNRIIPVVIFLRPGKHEEVLKLGTKENVFMSFKIVTCDLWKLPVDSYLNSQNIVARVTLPIMKYSPDRKVEVYAKALEGLAELEADPEKRIKFGQFIEFYAKLNEAELEDYKNNYLLKSKHQEKIMGIIEESINVGKKEGREEGKSTALENLLRIKFREDAERWISQLPDYPETAIDKMTERILFEDSIEKIFQGLEKK